MELFGMQEHNEIESLKELLLLRFVISFCFLHPKVEIQSQGWMVQGWMVSQSIRLL